MTAKEKGGDGPFKVGRKIGPTTPIGRWERVVENSLISKGYPARDRIFASSAGLCSRQTAGLMLLNSDVVEARKASTQFYFKIGSAFEKVMERAFVFADIFIDSETRIEAYHDELPVSGRIDFVLNDPQDGEVTLVELKTCGAKLPTKIKPPHLAQLMVYLALTGMRKGLVWYVSRTVAGWDGELKQTVFEVNPTDDEIRETLLKVAIGAVFGEAEVLPELPEDMKRYKCGFCPLIPFCWDGKGVSMEARSAKATTRRELLHKASVIVDDVMARQKSLKKMFIEAVT